MQSIASLDFFTLFFLDSLAPYSVSAFFSLISCFFLNPWTLGRLYGPLDPLPFYSSLIFCLQKAIYSKAS